MQIAANLHDDVGARLTKMAMVTEFVDRETAETDPGKPHIQTLGKTTREIIQAMDEIVWTINPKNDTLDDLANYIFQYAQEYFQDTAGELPARCARPVARLADVHRSAPQPVHGRQRGAEQRAQALPRPRRCRWAWPWRTAG